jgi:hypothetical protein
MLGLGLLGGLVGIGDDKLRTKEEGESVFAKHLSTKLAFFLVFLKILLLATHHVTGSNANALKSTSGTR